MTDVIQIATTTAEKEDAQKIATALVLKRLAACAQVSGPITSCYWWQGRVEVADEWLCVAKTKRDQYGQVEKASRELHPYDVPEMVAVPVVSGSAPYLRWLEESLG